VQDADASPLPPCARVRGALTGADIHFVTTSIQRGFDDCVEGIQWQGRTLAEDYDNRMQIGGYDNVRARKATGLAYAQSDSAAASGEHVTTVPSPALIETCAIVVVRQSNANGLRVHTATQKRKVSLSTSITIHITRAWRAVCAPGPGLTLTLLEAEALLL
jgi:hypothetical protein